VAQYARACGLDDVGTRTPRYRTHHSRPAATTLAGAAPTPSALADQLVHLRTRPPRASTGVEKSYRFESQVRQVLRIFPGYGLGHALRAPFRVPQVLGGTSDHRHRPEPVTSPRRKVLIKLSGCRRDRVPMLLSEISFAVGVTGGKPVGPTNQPSAVPALPRCRQRRSRAKGMENQPAVLGLCLRG